MISSKQLQIIRKSENVHHETLNIYYIGQYEIKLKASYFGTLITFIISVLCWLVLTLASLFSSFIYSSKSQSLPSTTASYLIVPQASKQFLSRCCYSGISIMMFNINKEQMTVWTMVFLTHQHKMLYYMIFQQQNFPKTDKKLSNY